MPVRTIDRTYISTWLAALNSGPLQCRTEISFTPDRRKGNKNGFITVAGQSTVETESAARHFAVEELEHEARFVSGMVLSSNQEYAHSICRLRNIVFIFFLLRWSKKSFYYLRGYGINGAVINAYISLRKLAYALILKTPSVRKQVDKDVATAITELQSKLVPSGPEVKRYLTLPKEPWTAEQLKAEIGKLSQMERTRWEDGKVSGAVYHGGEDLLKVQALAMETFGVANPIHPDVFPGVRKMEAEVVAMVLAMFNAPSDGAGTLTSGGTESILSACYSARQRAYAERGVTEPEM